MENMSLKIESVIKLVVFLGGLLAHYFWIKNSIAILNERQENIKEDIVDLLDCSNNLEKDLHKIDNRLTKCETCITSIKKDIDRIKG